MAREVFLYTGGPIAWDIPGDYFIPAERFMPRPHSPLRNADGKIEEEPCDIKMVKYRRGQREEVTDIKHSQPKQ
jgi:hypothetical protein